MLARADASWRRKLAQLRREREVFSASDLARRLLSFTAPVEESLARRLVATALGVPCNAVPARIEPDLLPTLVHGPAAQLPLERAEFVVVDLETTGLSLRRATILEIGAVRVAGPRRLERFHTLCDPQESIPARISRLTGIDARTVASAPALREAIGAFRRWLARFSGAPFVAHNARFDERFVGRALDRHGLPPLDRPVLCTRKLARRLVPELGRFGLDSLCAHLGIPNHARHRALGDAEAAARVLIELIDLARTRAALASLGDLLEFQDGPPDSLRAT